MCDTVHPCSLNQIHSETILMKELQLECDSSHVKTKPATAGAGKMIRFGSEVQKATIKEKTQYFKKDN